MSLLFLFIPFITACTGGDTSTTAMLDRAEALMEDNPNSAYTLLYNIDLLRIESDDAPSLHARYYLLPGTAINKTDPKYNDIYIGQYTSINPYYVWN